MMRRSVVKLATVHRWDSNEDAFTGNYSDSMFGVLGILGSDKNRGAQIASVGTRM